MRIILVRHGRTHSNDLGVYNYDDEPLNPKGIAQARLLGERLSEEKFDAIISSPLKRAKQTTEEILVHHPQMPVSYDLRIAEINYGIFIGRTYASLREARDALSVREEHIPDFKPVGGESITEARERIASFLADVLLLYKDQTVLVVSHGAALTTLLSMITGSSWAERSKFGHDNTGVTVIEFDEQCKATIHEIASVKHLPEHLRSERK